MDLYVEKARELIETKFGHNPKLECFALGILAHGIKDLIFHNCNTLMHTCIILKIEDNLNDEEWKAILKPIYEHISSS